MTPTIAPRIAQKAMVTAMPSVRMFRSCIHQIINMLVMPSAKKARASPPPEIAPTKMALMYRPRGLSDPSILILHSVDQLAERNARRFRLSLADLGGGFLDLATNRPGILSPKHDTAGEFVVRAASRDRDDLSARFPECVGFNADGYFRVSQCLSLLGW